MTTLPGEEANNGPDPKDTSDILAIAAYYERKERLRPRRQSSQEPATDQNEKKEEASGTKPAAASGSGRKRKTPPKSLDVGQRIEVLFDAPPQYFPGTIMGRVEGKYAIEYDDGDTEVLDLDSPGVKNASYRVLGTATAMEKRRASAGKSSSSSSQAAKQRNFKEGSRRSGRVKAVEAEQEEKMKKTAAEKKSAKTAGKSDSKQPKKKQKQEEAVPQSLQSILREEDPLWNALESEAEAIGAYEAAASDQPHDQWGGEENLDPVRVDAYRKALRRRWEFAGLCHFCWLFSTDLKVKKFSSDQLENALLDPETNQLFLTELLYRLCRENPYSTPPESKFYARESNLFMDKWMEELEKRLKTRWFRDYFEITYAERGLRRPLEPPPRQADKGEGEDAPPVVENGTPHASQVVGAQTNKLGSAGGPKHLNFMHTTPMDRLLVLHSLIQWRIEACPYVRDAVDRTVKDSEYGAPALREEPMAVDRHGNRYYYLSQGGEDCRLYAEKPAMVTMGTCLTADTQALAEFCTPCSSLEDMQGLASSLESAMAERQGHQKKQKKAARQKQGRSRALESFWAKVDEREGNEGELVRLLKEEVVPHLEETSAARKRREEREKLYEMAVKKRSSRIASIHVQKEAEEQKKLERRKEQEEMAIQREIAKKEKERERRLMERRLQMQQALEQARKVELENRVRTMLQRQARYVHRLNLSSLMREEHHLNTKAWADTVRDVDEGKVAWGVRQVRDQRGEDRIDRNYVFVHEEAASGRERRMPLQTAKHAETLHHMKQVAVSRQLRQYPGLGDDRLVKLSLYNQNLSKKQMLNTPEEDLRYLKVKMTLTFAKKNSFDEVHQRGVAAGLFTEKGIDQPPPAEAAEEGDHTTGAQYAHIEEINQDASNGRKQTED